MQSTLKTIATSSDSSGTRVSILPNTVTDRM